MRKKQQIVVNVFFVIMIVLSLITTFMYKRTLLWIPGILMVVGAIWNWYLFTQELKK